MDIRLKKLRYIKLNRQTLPDDPYIWLHQLKGPVVIDVAGRYQHKTRVISALIHGNEPSSFYAIHRWLISNSQPYCNVRFIIASVEAAQQEPCFHLRYADGVNDLNRQFSLQAQQNEPLNSIALRAFSIKQAINEVAPEAVVDMHNTSGASPAFSVATKIDMKVQGLASFFCQTMIYTRLKLGALMEQEFGCPIVTIECGGAQDQQAHEMAFQGLNELLTADNLFSGHHYQLFDIVEHPLRLEIDEHVRLTFAEHCDPNADVTLVSDIEQHNMGITRADCFIGWSKVGIEPFRVKNEVGESQSNDLIYCQDHLLFTRQALRIFMATNNSVIAQKDCLFYAFLCTA